MIQHGQLLSFSLHDEVEGQPLTPQNVELLTLHQFMGEVIALVQGDFRRAELGQALVAIEAGSVKLVSLVSRTVAVSLYEDLEELAHSGDLDSISPKRAEVIEAWQARAAKTEAKRHYAMVAHLEGKNPAELRVSGETRFCHQHHHLWIYAERYLTGRVVDLGGKSRPNVHLVLASGDSVKIDASVEQLEGADYLYKTVTLNVSVREHIRTGEFRQARLIDVEKPVREVDEDRLETLWQRGKKAWEGIGSANEWVEELRHS